MFIRTKSTPNSPRKSVQIVQSIRKDNKVSQKIIRHIGIAMDNEELEQLEFLAESIKIKLESIDQKFLFSPEDLSRLRENSKVKEDENDYKVNLKNIVEEDRVVSGIHDIYGKLFDELRYECVIKNPKRYKAAVRMFRDVVLARIANPRSKRSSVAMLEEDFGTKLNLDRVYSMMDLIDDEAIERLNDITYQHTLGLFKEKIDVIFFDCTTLYFETFIEDELRRNGFSKDLKFNQPQVLFALMVTKQGLPIGYKIFEGDKYEGHTVIPVLNEIKKKHDLGKVIFVADAGMFNNDNLEQLEELQDRKIEYVVGARLKNLPKKLQEEILGKNNKLIKEEDMLSEFRYHGRRLIVNYNEERACKDAHDRRKAVEKLRKKIQKNKNSKEYLSNYGYRKYLKVEGESTVELNEEKIKQASQWDGLHGVISNAKDISNKDILDQYHNLWTVEEAFRINKHDLKVRPIFHWKPRRVKAHLAISFTAYVLVKYLEYRVKLQYKKMSPERIRQTLIRVQTSILFDKVKKIRYGLPSKISSEARKMYKMFTISQRLTPYVIKKM